MVVKLKAEKQRGSWFRQKRRKTCLKEVPTGTKKMHLGKGLEGVINSARGPRGCGQLDPAVQGTDAVNKGSVELLEISRSDN